MKTDNLQVLSLLIEESNYPREELQKGVDLKLILEHACTVGYLTEDEKLKLQVAFQ
ncbi:hypothetical protein [Priestia megaterium]|uniref:hypothetical protein n=1 Tax=Priestia megaterium TaxID=1404 RepID=UPI00159BAD14|nr:hypothetical protein [Priestia megaterium]